MLVGGAMIVIASLFFDGTVLPMVAIMTACAVGALALCQPAMKRRPAIDRPEDEPQPAECG